MEMKDVWSKRMTLIVISSLGLAATSALAFAEPQQLTGKRQKKEVGMLLPAVQKVREASGRSSAARPGDLRQKGATKRKRMPFQNNLKQIPLALH
jgi:hypothetical protein